MYRNCCEVAVVSEYVLSWLANESSNIWQGLYMVYRLVDDYSASEEFFKQEEILNQRPYLVITNK